MNFNGIVNHRHYKITIFKRRSHHGHGENLFNNETYGCWKHRTWNLIHLFWTRIRNHADRNRCESVKEKEASEFLNKI